MEEDILAELLDPTIPMVRQKSESSDGEGRQDSARSSSYEEWSGSLDRRQRQSLEESIVASIDVRFTYLALRRQCPSLVRYCM